MICEFQGPHRWLSNFWPAPVQVITGRCLDEYPTVEHAYQAAKFTDPVLQLEIRASSTPGRAKRLAKELSVFRREYVVEDWEEHKTVVMLDLVRQKFRQHPELRVLLLATRNETLVEGNLWHDTFWGVCHCPQHRGQGLNHLGRILMQVRDELRKEEV